jgi:nucleotide-binding universal stress UspA family protein
MRLAGGHHVTGRIVVGIDGSQQSGNALEWTVGRARLEGEQLQLVRQILNDSDRPVAVVDLPDS